MIVAWIILIYPFANEPHQEIAIYPFVVMERHQVKVVQPEYCRDAENYDRTDSPVTLREVTSRDASATNRRSPLASTEARVFLLPLDFEELIVTHFSNLFVARKELIINGHRTSFQWPYYCIINLVVLHQLFRVRRTCINPLNLSFSLGKLQPVGPNVSRVSH